MPGTRNKHYSNSAQGLSATDAARLRSWALDIAAALLPGATWQDDGTDRRADRSGGFAVHRTRGCWFHHASGRGSYDTIGLIEHLKSCSRADATAWAIQFLVAHPGTGSCLAADADGDDEESGAGAAVGAIVGQELLARSIAITGTIGETYLQRRGLAPPYPEWCRFVENARAGDDALLTGIEAAGRVVGIQILYLAPDGSKSLATPQRRTFYIDRQGGRAGVFHYQPDVSKADLAPRPLLLAEGAEDCLSLATAYPEHRIYGLPGIGALLHVQVAKGAEVIVCRDGDQPGSEADRALIRALDALLLQQAIVRVTQPPLEQDNNDVLRDGGVEALRRLVEAAAPAVLSPAGEVTKVARIADRVTFELQRKELAKRLGIRVDVIDAERKRLHAVADAEVPALPSPLIRRDAAPWQDSVELSDVLGTFDKKLEDHHGCSGEQRTLAILWAAHTFIYWRFPYTPRLALSSPHPQCGKSTLCTILGLTCYRPVDCDSLTGATLRRMKGATGWATLVLDEISELIAASEELDAVLRSGFEIGRRAIRLVKDPEGNFAHEAYEVDLAVVISGIKAVAGALSTRAIHLVLQPAPKDRKLTKLRAPGSKAAFLEIGQKLARWAADQGEDLNLEPEIPEELDDRQADFSLPLLAIADQAGGDWPERARAALVKILGANNDLSQTRRQQLLADIVQVLQTPPWIKHDELNSTELVRALHVMPDAPWNGSDGNPPLTTHKLAELLRPYEIVPGQIGPEANRRRGYLRSQFARWLVPLSSAGVSPQTAQSAQPAQAPENPDVSATNPTPMAERTRSAEQTGDRSAPPPEIAEQALARSATADCSGKNGGNLGAEQPEHSERSIERAPHGYGNGADLDPGRTAFLAELRELKQADPNRKLEWLAKKLGRPKFIIAEALQELGE